MNREKNARPDISLVIPAYNDGRHLAGTLETARRYLSESGLDWEIIVVNDGSSDDTAAAARAAMAACPAIRLVELPENRGKGAAVRQGVLAARGRNILFSDSDLSTPVEETAKLLAAVEGEGYDLAIASRGLPGSLVARPQPGARRFIGRCFPLLVRFFITRRFHDTQCGFKIFRADVARRLFEPLRTRGFAFDVEILRRALREKYRVKEVPVTWVNCPDSRVRMWREPLLMLRDVIRIRFLK